MTATIAIVVVNYGSHELVAANLGAVDAQVVIVDNFSSDAERSSMTRLCDERGWHLEKHPNLGFGTGMNRGVERARSLGCDTFVLANPDLVIDPGTLAELATRAREDRTTLHGPVILHPDGRVWFSGGAVRVSAGVTTTAPGTDASAPGGWLTGACVALHDDLWTRAHGFDDDYFLYWEDVDFSWRVTDAGGHLRVWSDLTVTHDVGGTQEGSGKSPTYVYYNCRNRLLFAAKHLSPRDRLRWLVRTPTYARRVALRGGKRAFRANAAALTWAAVRGSIAGVCRVVIDGSRTRTRTEILS